MRCETVGSRVLGFVCDAGGNNARLFTLLRDKMPIPEGGWVPIETVKTENPSDPNRNIYLFHCSTHDLKNIRNALYTSWRPGGKKQFLDDKEIKIGKAVIEDCFERDRQRELRCHAPHSDVRESTVFLNKWSKMDASEAKRPFSWKTLAEISSHLYTKLGVTKSEQLSKEKHGLIGYMPAVAIHLKSILKEKPPPDAEILAPSISSFEWLANVHEIFNATLMNTKGLFLQWHNIDRYEEQIKKCLDCFERMRRRQLERRLAGDENWKLSFFASETWRNLRITCRGFFAYCRAIIEYSDYAPKGSIQKVYGVSPAHSNSSILEAWFSAVRNSNQDSGTSYAAFVGNRDMFKAQQALKNNKMYSADDLGDTSVGKMIGPRSQQ
ncbi:hypothetical protein ACHAXR_010210 [Thalassiosira sp. AJA248-18]